MDMSFLDHLRIQEYHVQLRLEDPVQLHYFHGPALNGMLCSAMSCHPLGPNLVLYPVESGRIEYAKGGLYSFGLTLIGECPDLAEEVYSCLIRHGQVAPDGKAFGHFSVERFEPCDPMLPAPEDLADERTVQFVTPLRMERKDGGKGQRFFDPQHFEGERFLRLLHDRAYDLCKLSNVDLPPYELPEIPETEVLEHSLTWMDTPYHGGQKTFGGVIGFVRLRIASIGRWASLLHVGQYIGVGRNTAFGFGHYWLEPPPAVDAAKPSQTLMDMAMQPARLFDAFNHIKAEALPAGSDGETIEGFEENLFENLAVLRQSVCKGTYRASVLKQTPAQDNGQSLATVRDRLVQQAVRQVLEPAFDHFLKWHSYACRNNANQAIVASETMQWACLKRKLKTLYTCDPIVDTIMAWITQSVICDGKVTQRSQGLPHGLSISPLLAQIYTWIE